jgi:hypothetical protein
MLCRSIIAALVTYAFVHASAQSPSTPSGLGIGAIKAYEGTWKFSSVSLDTPYSKAGKDEKVLRNDCWRSASYYVCNQFVDGVSQLLIVYTYDQQRNVYTSYLVPLDGTAASSGTLEINGDTWTYPWEVTENGSKVYVRVVNVFKSPESILYRREFSRDKVNWTVMATGNEVRTK